MLQDRLSLEQCGWVGVDVGIGAGESGWVGQEEAHGRREPGGANSRQIRGELAIPHAWRPRTVLPQCSVGL